MNMQMAAEDFGEVMSFRVRGRRLRVILHDGTARFVLKDVGRIMGGVNLVEVVQDLSERDDEVLTGSRMYSRSWGHPTAEIWHHFPQENMLCVVSPTALISITRACNSSEQPAEFREHFKTNILPAVQERLHDLYGPRTIVPARPAEGPDVHVYSYGGRPIGTVALYGTTYFVVEDVCRASGFHQDPEKPGTFPSAAAFIQYMATTVLGDELDGLLLRDQRQESTQELRLVAERELPEMLITADDLEAAGAFLAWCPMRRGALNPFARTATKHG